MKKILFSMVFILSTLFIGVSVNAEEVTTEYERTEYGFTIETLDGNLIDDTWVTEFTYADFIYIDIDTLNIWVDNVIVIDDGVAEEGVDFYRYDGEEDKELNMLFYINLFGETHNKVIFGMKDGQGAMYNYNRETKQSDTMEVRFNFIVEKPIGNELEPPTSEAPISEQEIESWLTNLLDNYFGWFLVLIGVSAATIASAIVGMVKLIAYFKATQLGLKAVNEGTSALSNKVLTLSKKVDNVNKAGALGVYTAEAISEIIDSSNNPRITSRRDELKQKYIKALNSKDLSDEEAEEIKKEFEKEFLVKNVNEKNKAKTKQDDIDEIVKKIKG